MWIILAFFSLSFREETVNLKFVLGNGLNCWVIGWGVMLSNWWGGVVLLGNVLVWVVG